MHKMVFRPGTVKKGLYIKEYDFYVLTLFIKEFDLRYDDWITTSQPDEYITKNWMRLFAKVTTARGSVSTGQSYNDRVREFKQRIMEELLRDHHGSPHRLERLQGVARKTCYRVLGVAKVREIYKELNPYKELTYE